LISVTEEKFSSDVTLIFTTNVFYLHIVICSFYSNILVLKLVRIMLFFLSFFFSFLPPSPFLSFSISFFIVGTGQRSSILLDLSTETAYLLQLRPARLTTLMLLINVSAMVTVYRGHDLAFFLPWIIFLMIMCTRII